MSQKKCLGLRLYNHPAWDGWYLNSLPYAQREKINQMTFPVPDALFPIPYGEQERGLPLSKRLLLRKLYITLRACVD